MRGGRETGGWWIARGLPEGRIDERDWEYLRQVSETTHAHSAAPALEIGAFLGLSTLALLAGGGQVETVDDFSGSGVGGWPRADRDLFAEFAANVDHRASERLIVRRGRSEDVLPKLVPPYRMAFVDGSHQRATVRNDLHHALRLTDNGTVLVDDLHFEGVRAAVDDLALTVASRRDTRIVSVYRM